MKEKFETEDDIEWWIWSEKAKTKDFEKSIKHNAKVYKDDIKQQMIKILEKKGDPSQIKVTASSSFKEKLIIE